MNAGQMIVQMPLGALLTGALPELSPAGFSAVGEQNAGVFAGILGELSAQDLTGMQRTSGSEQMVSPVVPEMKGATVVEEVVSGSMAAMPHMVASLLAGVGVQQQIQSAGSKANQFDEVKDELQQIGTETPQNVEPSIAGAQIVPAPQVDGRMPTSEQKTDLDKARSTQDQPVSGIAMKQVFRPDVLLNREQEQALHTDDIVESRNQMPQNVESPREAVAQAILPEVNDKPVPEQKSVFQDIAGNSPNPVSQNQASASTIVSFVPSKEQEQAGKLPANDVVGMRDQMPQNVESRETVVQAVPVFSSVEGMIPVSEQKSVHKGEFASSPVVIIEQTAETDSSLSLNETRQNTAPEKAAALIAEQVNTAPEVPERVSVMKSVVVDRISAQQPRVSKPEVQVESAVVAEKSAPAHPSGFRFAHSAVVDVALGNGQQVSPRIMEKQGSDAIASVQTAIPQPEVLETASNEPQFTFSEHKSAGFMQQGPEHPAAQHIVAGPQSFTAAMSATTPLQAVSDEPARLILHENIAGQVRERISTHDIKTGSDQIVFRLSPENMGEIKVHLRLEDQRLRVEIVAENRVAREGLIQHMDSLKESMARQNISIDKFSVTSGESQANSQGGNGAQGEWRELVKNRQSQQWMTSGGYRIPSDEIVPPRQMYRSGTEHAMLDVHF